VSNVVDDAPLSNLEEVFGPLLTSLSFGAPPFSNTPMDTRVSDLTLLASPLPLAQSMGLEDNSLVWLEYPILVEPCLEVAPFEKLCHDIVMGTATPSIGLIDSICTEPLDSTPISFLYFSPPPLMRMHFMCP